MLVDRVFVVDQLVTARVAARRRAMWSDFVKRWQSRW